MKGKKSKNVLKTERKVKQIRIDKHRDEYKVGGGIMGKIAKQEEKTTCCQI